MNKTKVISILLVLLFLFSVFFITTNYLEKKEEVVLKTEQEREEVREKIGQMLVVGFRGSEVDDESSIIKAIKELNLGGVILFDYDVPSKGEVERNIINPEQTKKLVEKLKEVDSSLFIAVDAEGGYINRLKEKYGFENIPSAQEMGEGSVEETKNYGLFLGERLSDIGFNVNFAPVVDVNVNSDNPVIGGLERSFSDDPEKVFLHATAFIEGLNEKKVVSAVKHFPGHGSSEDDSHLGMVDITDSWQKEEELYPYKKIVENGYSDMIMTAHVINSNVDSEHPATLSSLFLKDILRDEIGFEGVIVSDDMHMGAIVDHYGYEEALIKSINAGCNILIISNNGETYNEDDYYRAVDVIFQAVESGEVKKEIIDESYEKIINLKKKYNIIK
jgi:beta-N-acetylhexosaminidase